MDETEKPAKPDIFDTQKLADPVQNPDTPYAICT